MTSISGLSQYPYNNAYTGVGGLAQFLNNTSSSGSGTGYQPTNLLGAISQSNCERWRRPEDSRRSRVVLVVPRGGPRARRSALTSDAAARAGSICEPTRATRHTC